MTRTFAAAVFALLAATTPAHAAYVYDVNLDFPSNNQVIGGIDLQPGTLGASGTYQASADPSGLSFNGNPVTLDDYSGKTVPAMTFFLPVLGSGPDFFDINTANIPSLRFVSFTLNGAPATGGSVSCRSGCALNPVPLPAALPLFGTAIAGLGGAGWWRRRKVSRNRQA